ncbi:hypothetical protein K435DRAFT_966643 [Dendrothele bispora CBS 962.96]|uniref:Uncharacterized protein n=1 Tax=Dendrothele bispora (strain CBS 962.96) TaxID=1314807 RepID=A0A4S8LYT4_DENBC|nr:hypothetical protein K435DRAFT_966643 [Dendrothele bispora CBS 962.96]
MDETPWAKLSSEFPLTPFPHLLAVPTATERNVIQMVINIAEECLSRLDQAILHADQIPEEIISERHRRSDFIKQHKQMLLLSDFPPAPYPHLLALDTIPNAEQRDTIEMVINIAQECLSRLDQAFLHVDQVPREIISEQHRRSDFIKQHKQMLGRTVASIRTLTYDVMLKIFKVCVQLDVETRPDPGLISTRKRVEYYPLLLTHVCSEWRRVALSSPLLWNTVSYKDPAKSSSRVIETQFNRIKAWIERSGPTCPLFVRIDWGWDLSLEHHQVGVRERRLPSARGEGGAGNANPSKDDALKLLVSQSHRWVTVDMHVPSPAFCKTLASMAAAGFPQLKRLCVLPLMQTNLPRTEGGEHTGLVFTDLTSMWGQLTHLSVAVALPKSTSEPHWCQALFDAVPLLESLHLTVKLERMSMPFYLFPRPHHAQDIHHPRLQNLTLDFEVTNLPAQDDFDCLLDGLTLPCLNKLSLTAYAWGTSGIISSFFMRHPSLEFIVLRKFCTPHELGDRQILLKKEYPYVSLMRVGLGSDSRYHHHYAGEPVTLDLYDWNIHRRRLGQNRKYEETRAGRIHYYAGEHHQIVHLQRSGQRTGQSLKYEETRARKIELQENSKEIRRISMPLLTQPKETDRVTLPPGANWAIISQGDHPLEVLPSL